MTQEAKRGGRAIWNWRWEVCCAIGGGGVTKLCTSIVRKQPSSSIHIHTFITCTIYIYINIDCLRFIERRVVFMYILLFCRVVSLLIIYVYFIYMCTSAVYIDTNKHTCSDRAGNLARFVCVFV